MYLLLSLCLIGSGPRPVFRIGSWGYVICASPATGQLLGNPLEEPTEWLRKNLVTCMPAFD